MGPRGLMGPSWGPSHIKGPSWGSLQLKKNIFFSIWAPHNEVSAPEASWAPAGALSTLKKIERHIHDFHDRNNKRIKFVDTKCL